MGSKNGPIVRLLTSFVSRYFRANRILFNDERYANFEYNAKVCYRYAGFFALVSRLTLFTRQENVER